MDSIYDKGQWFMLVCAALVFGMMFGKSSLCAEWFVPTENGGFTLLVSLVILLFAFCGLVLTKEESG